MSDIDQRVERLKDRVKRKRAEVCQYLDLAFYRNCHSILDDVMKDDVGNMFAENPSKIQSYSSVVHQPMWWGLILTRLNHYDYSDPIEFVRDMRLVVDNCYTFNGKSSQISVLCRRIEIHMEDLFVTELCISPPDAQEIVKLGRGADRELSTRILKILYLYEGKSEERDGKQKILPSKWKCATQRRVIALLRANAKNREERGKAERPPVPQPIAKAVPKLPPQLPQHKQPARTILETDADVEFAADARNNDVKQETRQEQHQQQQQQLERVPQNRRTVSSAFRPVSPVCFDGSASDGSQGTSGEAED